MTNGLDVRFYDSKKELDNFLCYSCLFDICFNVVLSSQHCAQKSVPMDDVSLLILANVSQDGEDWTAPVVRALFF